MSLGRVALLIAYVALMFGVCMLACAAPDLAGAPSRADGRASIGVETFVLTFGRRETTFLPSIGRKHGQAYQQ